MAKMENIETAVAELYMELGRETIRYELCLKEIERLKAAELSCEHTEKRAVNIKAKVDELTAGVLQVVISTKKKGESLL